MNNPVFQKGLFNLAKNDQRNIWAYRYPFDFNLYSQVPIYDWAFIICSARYFATQMAPNTHPQ
ncbi:MAG TPA: hypothetical protein DEB50_09655 [Desulfobacter sp.]|nr:hypothetical protein [Desulfobacter sp.]